MLGGELGQLSYVVGFDLGHGETALMAVNLKSEHANDRAFKVEIDGKSNFITAIANHPQHGVLIGRDALTTDGVDASFIAFKQRPGKDSQYRDVIRDYARHIYSRLLKSRYGFSEDNTCFYVGCPTDWARDATILAYQSLFKNAGFREVKVVAESRGALMNGVESGDILATVGELRGRALVVDLGSSTADFTLIDLQQRRADPLDFGHDLGAALIDKLIFRDTLKEHKRRDELTSIFLRSPTMRNRCELACRDAKEAWFNNPKATPSKAVEVLVDDLFFTVRLDETRMQRLLQQPFTVLEDLRPLFGAGLPHLSQTTWPEALETLLQQTKKVGGDPDIILVTGGASRMHFVKPLCMKHFPTAKYSGSAEPEFAIAAGLAYWGRVDIRTQGFVRDVEDFAERKIRPEVASRVAGLYSSLSATIADDVTAIVKVEFDGWKSKRYATVNEMKSGIDRKIKQWIDKKLEMQVQRIVDNTVSNIGGKLADEIKELERQFGIPIGSLGASFTSSGLSNVDVDIALSGIDFLDGVADGLGSVIGVIAGLVTGVVAWVVTPIILGIVLKIVAAVSIALASALFTILVSNPAGWVVLAGIGIAAIAAGGEAKRKVQEKVPEWDLPGWVRDLVKKDSIYQQIDGHRGEISRQINAALEQKKDIDEKIVESLTQAFKTSLKAKADQARLLIT